MHGGGTTSGLQHRSSSAGIPDDIPDEVTIHASNLSADRLSSNVVHLPLDEGNGTDDQPTNETDAAAANEANDEISGLESGSGIAINAVDTGIGPAKGFPDILKDDTNIIYGSLHDTMNLDPDGDRAQMDTGAFVSCTDRRDLIHDYTEFSPTNPCPIKLMPATVGSDAVPKGYGFLHVPARNSRGYLAVRVFHTPKLRTTVIDERDLILAAGHSPNQIRGESIIKNYDGGFFTYRAEHKLKKSYDVVVQGILKSGKCYSDVLLKPKPDSCSDLYRDDPEFEESVKRATIMAINAYQEGEYDELRGNMQSIPRTFHNLPFHRYIQESTPIQALRAEAERLLWHQRLGHPSDYYLYQAHKHIKGVPEFKHHDRVLDICPTCIRAKQTKEPAGPNTTRTARTPYQGLSIDFSFSGSRSKDEGRAQDFVGFNGETAWILVTDHFTRMKHGATRVSKASPMEWLKRFLDKYAPACDGKYVFLDQGGELYANPKVKRLFEDHGYEIRVTGADSSNQNGPVERGHLTVANAIRAMLTGAQLETKFWPYAFHHWLRIDNAIPSRDQELSPLEMAEGRQEDFSYLRTFGCRVWVRPPGRRRAKFVPNSRRGIFLGYLPRTTKNILWYDPETDKVKIAKHARFDEGMNDLPIDEIPPNVTQLQRMQHGEEIPADTVPINVPEFECSLDPFPELITKKIPIRCKDPTLGIVVESDEVNNRAYVGDLKDRRSVAKVFSSRKAATNKLRGAYIVKVNGMVVFTKEEAVSAIRKATAHGDAVVTIDFAPEKWMYSKERKKVFDEHNIHTPQALLDEDHVHQLTVADLRAITSLRVPNVEIGEDLISYDDVCVAIQAITSSAITDEEKNIGSFTRRKLKKLSTWPLWKAGEKKQLDQFHELGMFGPPVPRPKGSVLLRPHWQYQIKRDGTRRAPNCCDGSKRAAPGLHGLVSTYSSCVEQPIQRLFFAISAQMGYRIFGGDAKDAYAHSPPPETPTFVSIDDAYHDWYRERFPGKDLDRRHVLPVNHALQGHPESGRLWETHISKILSSTEFSLNSTTHDKSIYRGSVNGAPIFLLRQVDDFALAAPTEEDAKVVFDAIGARLKLPQETETPFKYLGLVEDFNGVDIRQTATTVEISCASYIDRILSTHGWTTKGKSIGDEASEVSSRPTAPLPMDCIRSMFETVGIPEGTAEHRALENRHGFAYRTLLGELMYAYVTCRPDIGYAVITLSKFSTAPGDFHFAMLKRVCRYLRQTKQWAIIYHKNEVDHGLPPSSANLLDEPKDVPKFPGLSKGFTPVGFLDAAHGTDLRKRRSITGYAFMMAGGCVSYRCKTQSITATSSTEAEFYAAVSSAKHARYLRAVLTELGFPPARPTILYCDNQSAIKMVNARIPTDRARHIAIQHFAIQDWKDEGSIEMQHIPGVINPSDDMTKPLGWVLHSRHCRRLMGHFRSSTGLD